jgi:hypothetical protein
MKWKLIRNINLTLEAYKFESFNSQKAFIHLQFTLHIISLRLLPLFFWLYMFVEEIAKLRVDESDKDVKKRTAT